MIFKGLRGGMWLELKKTPAVDRPIFELKAPSKIYLPLRQFQGTLPTVCVSEGDRVLIGQPVAKSAGDDSCSLHSPVSGTVCEITEYDHPIGGHSQMVVIENDGHDLQYKKYQIRRGPLPKGMAVIDSVKESAAVVASGFGQPLWVRLADMAKKKVKTIVLNDVETEPYICSSQKIIDENPDSVAQGLALIMNCIGATSAILAVSDDMPSDIVKNMKDNARLEGIMLRVAHVPQKYPLGIEHYLLRYLFANEIDSAPVSIKNVQPEDLHIGFICAQDCLNVSRACNEKTQLTRIITVAGDAVENPQNLEVRIGTTVRDVLEHCELSFDPDRIVLGSAMRGVAVSDFDTPITKSVTAVLALKAGRGGFTKSICINCGKCVSVCPEGLLPNYIAMRAVKADFDSLRSLHISECRECGLCSYICPGRMPIIELIKNIKKAAL